MKKRIHDFLPEVKDYYTIDDLGNVYSDNINGQKMKDRIIYSGYNRVALSLENGGQQDYFVHRLVLLAFNPIDNAENFQVNHLDANRSNNNLKNLEWCTASENQQYAVKLGNARVCHQYGEDNSMSKLSTEDVEEIFKLRAQGYTHQSIANKFNVSRRHIGNILQGKRRAKG